VCALYNVVFFLPPECYVSVEFPTAQRMMDRLWQRTVMNKMTSVLQRRSLAIHLSVTVTCVTVMRHSVNTQFLYMSICSGITLSLLTHLHS